jgi:hypothetical protein
LPGSELQKFSKKSGFSPVVQFSPSRCVSADRESVYGGSYLYDVLAIDEALGAVVLDEAMHTGRGRFDQPPYGALDPSSRWAQGGITGPRGEGHVPDQPLNGFPDPDPDPDPQPDDCPNGGFPPLCIEPPPIDPGAVCIGEIRWCKEKTLVFTPTEVHVAVTQSKAHTGRNSLLVRKDSPAFLQQVLDLRAESAPSDSSGQRPRPYVLSAWVTRDQEDVPTFVQPDGSPAIEVLPWEARCLPGGPLVEGWQRISCEFLVDSDDAATSVRFIAGPGAENNATYFDDVRIFPADASLETYVYDTKDLSMTAALDENNFSTQFAYDDDGSLYLVRKETVRGLLTVDEYRSHFRERTRAVAAHP